jgi:tubulin--tyrosine ligase
MESEEDFVQAHRAQLTQVGLPEHLWNSVWAQLRQAQLSYEGLQLARLLSDDGDAEPQPRDLVVLASRDLSPTSDVFVLDHAWTFRSLADASQALAQMPGLAQRVFELIHHVPCDDDDKAAARVLEGLPSLAGMYQIAAPSVDGEAGAARLELQTVYYVLDELGARIAVGDAGEDHNLDVAPFMHMHSGMSFCIAWPRNSVPAGGILRRAAMPEVAASLALGQQALQAHAAPPAPPGAGAATDSAEPAPVALCTVDCPYLRALVMRCFAKRPHWSVFESAEEAAAAGLGAVTYHWGEYEDLDWDQIDAGALSASCFVTRKGLIRKANLAYNINKWAAKRPDGALAAATPETRIVQVDGVDQIDAVITALGVQFHTDAAGHESDDSTATAWMLKPSVTNQAKGIVVARSRDEVCEALAAAPELREWVLQRYVQRPLLVDGRKFHLRVYVLAVGNIAVHVFPEFLALFSLEKYGPIPAIGGAGAIDAVDLNAHLTNTCAQGEMTEAEELLAVRMWRELQDDLEKQGHTNVDANMRSVEQSVHRVIGECFQAVHTELNFSVRTFAYA